MISEQTAAVCASARVSMRRRARMTAASARKRETARRCKNGQSSGRSILVLCVDWARRGGATRCDATRRLWTCQRVSERASERAGGRRAGEQASERLARDCKVARSLAHPSRRRRPNGCFWPTTVGASDGDDGGGDGGCPPASSVGGGICSQRRPTGRPIGSPSSPDASPIASGERRARARATAAKKDV